MRYSLPLLVLALLPAPLAQAQIFRAYSSTAMGSWPEAVATGDLNGDGLVDVVVSTGFYFDPLNDHSIHVFPGLPGGRLGPSTRYPAGQRPEGMAVGDVSGDGLDDVVVANFGNNTVGVFVQSAGALLPMVTHTTAQGPESIAIADLNGDGRLDVAVSHWNADVIGVFLQSAGGALQAMTSYRVTTGGYGEIATGDLNADGLSDVVYMSGQLYAVPNIAILYQSSSGTLGNLSSYNLAGNVLTRGVAVGDLNGDGREDVACTYGGNSPSAGVAVWYQNVAGTLDPPQTASAYDIPEPAVIADVTGDGLGDLVVAHGGWNAMSVYPQSPTGGIQLFQRYSLPYASHYNPKGLHLADVSGDGLPEALVADYNHGLVQLRHTTMPLAVSPGVQSAFETVDVEFFLNQPSRPGRSYILLSTFSGSSPGFSLGGLVVPINIDPFTLLGLELPQVFQGFVGTLDSSGHARARLLVPLAPGIANVSAHFAYFLYNPVDYASPAVEVRIVP